MTLTILTMTSSRHLEAAATNTSTFFNALRAAGWPLFPLDFLVSGPTVGGDKMLLGTLRATSANHRRPAPKK